MVVPWAFWVAVCVGCRTRIAWVVRRRPAELRSWRRKVVSVRAVGGGGGEGLRTGWAENSMTGWMKTLAQTVAAS